MSTASSAAPPWSTGCTWPLHSQKFHFGACRSSSSTGSTLSAARSRPSGQPGWVALCPFERGTRVSTRSHSIHAGLCPLHRANAARPKPQKHAILAATMCVLAGSPRQTAILGLLGCLGAIYVHIQNISEMKQIKSSDDLKCNPMQGFLKDPGGGDSVGRLKTGAGWKKKVLAGPWGKMVVSTGLFVTRDATYDQVSLWLSCWHK